MTAPIMGVGRTALIATILVAIGPLSMALYTPAMPMLVTSTTGWGGRALSRTGMES